MNKEEKEFISMCIAVFLAIILWSSFLMYIEYYNNQIMKIEYNDVIIQEKKY